jgi:hypothetical protein
MITLQLQFTNVSDLTMFLQTLSIPSSVLAQLNRMETLLNASVQNERTIMATEQQMTDALNKIDAATTKAGTNLATLGATTQSISDEVDALEASLKAAGVSDALVAQASAIGDKTQAVSDSLDAHATFLTAIAAKGVANPVPVPPPDVPPAATA